MATEIVNSSSLGKRKAGTPESPEDEGEESDSSMVTDDEESEPEIEPEGELADDFSDQESLKPIDLNETVFGWPKSPDGTARGYMELMVALALDKYNQTQGLDVKMDHVVRAIAKKSGGIKCYITFMAREIPTGPLVEYQAKTEWKRRQVHTYPFFCRPSPPPVYLKEKARRSTRIRPRK